MIAGQPVITYEAAFDPNDGEVTVVRNVRAGISGPCGEYPATDLADAERVLFDNGYLTASGWSGLTVNGDHWCDLTRMA